MVLKHELQNATFTMDDDLPNHVNVIATDMTIATDITHVIIQLEHAAFKLQSMTVCLLSTYSYHVHLIYLL